MLSHLALTAALAALVSYTAAAPTKVIQARNNTPAASAGQPIKWKSDTGEDICLQVDGGVLQNGQGVGVGSCSAEASVSVFQSWVYLLGATTIQVAPNSLTDTPFCIDFGENLGADGQALKIWQCYQGLAQQNLWITEDNHIAVANGPGQCVDVRAESTSDDSGPYPVTKNCQSWTCTAGNTNQIFIFNNTPTPTPTPTPTTTQTPTPTPTPVATGKPILWRSDSGEEICLQVDGGVLQNGQGVGVGPCSAAASVFQSWVYTLGATAIQVAPNNLTETPFCLDFGENLGADGQDLKIWQCYQGLAQQNLFITEDNHIAVENGPGQCVDIRAESVSDDSGPYPISKTAQTFQCTAGNTNQIFIFNQTPTPPGPTPPGPTPPATEGQNITWVSDSGEEICLQVNNGVFENGQSVGVGPCSAEASVFQSWIYTPGATAIQVAPNNLTETPFCLDFGENLGTNGQAMKIWQCYQGAPQQSLFITEDNHIAVENGPGQCVDIRAESTSDDSGPYPITKLAQTYQCTAGNTNQIFVFP